MTPLAHDLPDGAHTLLPEKTNRAERRLMRNNLRAYRVAAAKARDQACSQRGVGTPARAISEDIKSRGLGRRWIGGEPWLVAPMRRGARRRAVQAKRRLEREARMQMLQAPEYP